MLMLLVIQVEANVIAYIMDGRPLSWVGGSMPTEKYAELRRCMWNTVVGCPTCGGRGYIVVGQSWGDPYGEQEQCPDCV